jgi:murein DD-endopeptidase MepM/ murein hydrolase activator NlpD
VNGPILIGSEEYVRQRIFFAVFVFIFTTLLCGPGASAQIRKSCGDAMYLKLTATSALQGTLLQAQISSTKALPQNISAMWDGKPSPVWLEEGDSKTVHGMIGIDLEKPAGRYEYKIAWKDSVGQGKSCASVVVVRTGKFPTEHLTVEKQFVQPDPEQQKRAEDDSKKMRAIYDTVTPERLWKGAFRVPLKGVETGGNFGRRRVLNGVARSPHAGVDFPAPTGTPVLAPQAGKVVLAEDLYYSGNTIVIDHGFGIYTLYAHLSQFVAHAGDSVEAGTEIGKVGATGRVTGPHLHWGLTIDHARVNALQIVNREP